MASRGIVNGPNQTHKGPRVNSSGPMGHGSGDVKAPNNENKTPRVNSCGPTGKGGSPMNPPNDRSKFRVEDADKGYKGYDAPVASPGVGSVPVNPFVGKNTFVPAHMLRDSAK